jgi:hypothetical protein
MEQNVLQLQGQFMDKLLSGQLVIWSVSVLYCGGATEVLSACPGWLKYTGLGEMRVVGFIYSFNLFLSLSTACSWLDGNSTVSCFANYAGNPLYGETGF